MRAERSEGYGVTIERGTTTSAAHRRTRPEALWIPKPLCACRGAEHFAERGPQLFERSEFCGPREMRVPEVARSEAEGHVQRGRLFLVTSFGEAKEVTRLSGRVPTYCSKTRSNAKQVREKGEKKPNRVIPCRPSRTIPLSTNP